MPCSWKLTGISSSGTKGVALIMERRPYEIEFFDINTKHNRFYTSGIHLKLSNGQLMTAVNRSVPAIPISPQPCVGNASRKAQRARKPLPSDHFIHGRLPRRNAELMIQRQHNYAELSSQNSSDISVKCERHCESFPFQNQPADMFHSFMN